MESLNVCVGYAFHLFALMTGVAVVGAYSMG